MSNSLLSNLNRDSDGGSDSQDAVLHPLLQAALLGLDTELDQELARYRRQRSLKPGRSPRRAQRSMHEPQERTPLPALAAGTAALAGLQSRQTAASPEQAIAPTPAALTAPGNQPLDTPVPDDYLESSEELLRSLADEAPPSPQPTYEPDEDEPGIVASLLTPLGIGSMLLLLLSSATLGYVILNPSLVGLPRLGQWGSDRSTAESVVSSSTQGGIPNPNLAEEEFVDLGLDTLSTLPRTGQPSQPSPPSANAAAPAPSANAPTTAPTTTSTALTTQLQPALTPEVVEPSPSVESDSSDVVYVPDPEPVAVAPAAPVQPPAPEPAYTPAPAPAPAETAAAPSTAPSNYYYVVTDYSGDRSLDDARQAVEDAYVRNFPDAGAQVQFGAFSDPERAEALLNELADQGIPAEIYQP
ncbi:MAG TPA: SPOR domain-containing protein [Candidatus Obscuribacterales bacterium]